MLPPRPFVALVALAAFSADGTGTPARQAPPVYELANGRWYDGSSFAARTIWTVNGHLTSRRPPQVDSLIDLEGGYVVPPFGEAHTHNIGCPPTEAEAAPYVRDGIFYVMTQSNTFPARAAGGAPGGAVDVICAGALLTPSGSHVALINEQSAERGNFPGLTRADLDGRTHVVIDTDADLDAKLGPILRDRPAFIKIILGFSEDWARRHADSAYLGKRGLDPALVPVIVRRAHEAGSRVSAHIETAADFRLAVSSGVDLIAHLPGYRIGAAAGFDDADPSRWLLTDEDAAAAAARQVTVITTVVAAQPIRTRAGQANAEREAISEIHRANIATLRRHQVPLLIGSDFYRGTSLVEALALGMAPLLGGDIAPLAVFGNADLLRLWSVDTPRAIFRDRRIGALEDGYEANLVVLAGDPLADFGNVRRIRLRMKAGALVP